MLNFHKFFHTNATMFARYFEYYAIILGGVFLWAPCIVKVSQFAVCMGQTLFSSKVIVWTHKHIHWTDCSGSLKWSEMWHCDCCCTEGLM